MSNVSFSLPPGQYIDSATMDWVVSDEVDYISYTANGPQPGISKHIAYDNLTPPNPFLSITEDGLGPVVYVGGLIAMMNSAVPRPLATSFAQMNGAMKFSFNALNFCVNADKVAAGNNKVLVLGDAVSGEQYPVKNPSVHGFNDFFNTVITQAGFVGTYKDRGDYGGQLNPTLSELNQYVAVIVVSCAMTSADHITSNAVDNIVEFRRQGNGILIYTDHGPNLTSLTQAATGAYTGFFRLANKVATRFGTYFTGDFTRTPVNVGFLRQTYGDHPLYNGLSDAENIEAGVSESKIVLADFEKFTPTELTPLTLGLGSHDIQAIASLTDGSTETYRFFYNIVELNLGEDSSLLRFLDPAGNSLTEYDVGFNNAVLVKVNIGGEDQSSINGRLLKNGSPIAELRYTPATGTEQIWSAEDGSDMLAVKDGDVLIAEILTPFQFTRSIAVSRFQPGLTNILDWGRVSELLDPMFPNEINGRAVANAFSQLLSVAPQLGYFERFSTAQKIQMLRDYFNDVGPASIVLPVAASMAYDDYNWFMYENYPKWNPVNPVTGGPIVFGEIVFSPKWGAYWVPLVTQSYFNRIYLAAGTYRAYVYADDFVELKLDGEIKIPRLLFQGEVEFTVDESKTYNAEVYNENITLNSPSWWIMTIIDVVTGEVVHTPSVGEWKIQELPL